MPGEGISTWKRRTVSTTLDAKRAIIQGFPQRRWGQEWFSSPPVSSLETWAQISWATIIYSKFLSSNYIFEFYSFSVNSGLLKYAWPREFFFSSELSQFRSHQILKSKGRVFGDNLININRGKKFLKQYLGSNKELVKRKPVTYRSTCVDGKGKK